MSHVRLKVLEGKPQGATIPVVGGSMTIGRDPSCQLRPKHESVGAQHCRIRVADDGRVSVRDLGSPSGTLLNGRKLSPADSVIARCGDHLQVGPLLFEVQNDSPAGGSLTVDKVFADDSPVAAVAHRLFQRHSSRELPETTIASGVRLPLTVVDGLPIVTVDIPRLEADALIPFRRELRDYAERPALVKVVMDMHKVQTVAFDAAVIIHAFHEKLRARGGVLKLCDVRPSVLRILEAEGVSELVPIAFDVHDAIWSNW